MDESTSKPLNGVLVVALEQAVAAPLATCRLADAGARVIKLERDEGDFARAYDSVANGQSAYFAWANRGKESLVVDIKKSPDVSLIQRIISQADVFIQNLGVGAAARVGLGSARLRAQHPRLITCDISGYGEDGPYAAMKAYDLLIQAETGLVSVSGPPGEYGRVGVSVCDVATGVSAALAINEAIIGRGPTGQGVAIRLSLFDVMAEWMSVPLLQYEYSGAGPDRVGLAHPSITPYGGFLTKDGATLVISVQNEREWHDLVTKVLDKPELASDARYVNNSARMRHRGQVDAIVQNVFAARSRKNLERQLSEARIAYGAVNGLDDLSKHPQLRRIRVGSETGEIDMPAHTDANRTIDPDARIPTLGQHSDAIRAEFSGK